MHWASEKIRRAASSSATDEELRDLIKCVGVSEFESIYLMK
jgi:hypothetical protein